MFVFSPFESRGIRLTALRTSTCSLLSGRLYEVMRVTAPYFSPLNTFCRKCKQIQVSNASLGLMDGFLIWGISSPVPTLSSQRTSLSADYSLKSFVSGLLVASEEIKINYSYLNVNEREEKRHVKSIKQYWPYIPQYVVFQEKVHSLQHENTVLSTAREQTRKSTFLKKI